MGSGRWPALDSEPQLWVPSAVIGDSMRSRARRTSYASSVPPLIAALTPDPGEEASGAADQAARELSRFDAELGVRVNSFAPVLLRSEAASSSQIENLTASARAIFSAELGAKSGRNAEQVAANTRSLQAAIGLSEDISAEAIAQMHHVLMAEQPRHTPGEWREEAVWIGTRSDSPVGAEFVAPHHDRVPQLIDDLVLFANREEVPPLVSIAIAHAQFETIHPFTDGNGRTGRALAQSMLRHREITRSVAVPVSAGLLADVEGYHAALTAYRAGDVDPIILAFADASLRAVGNARQLVAEIDAVRADWDSRLTARRDSNAWKLLDVLVRRPVLDSATAASELGVKQPNVYPPLRALVDAGILKSKAEHQLGPFWRTDEVLAAIDRFAKRAGRREAR
ncbi:Fic family protein [Leifsonia aquatica]|uniref:Fic family protein n=2 Tax=Leifsonia aquatica TaxID=144185 RepID=U2RCR0_LEIAQ|nr:Fic family protein [Leifsonia aquatica]ERK73020.1 Fic family protein [Leifsonia aquatica ATCC 14665]MBB2968117.1 Fic family protein [Leifsonia aquatica]